MINRNSLFGRSDSSLPQEAPRSPVRPTDTASSAPARPAPAATPKAQPPAEESAGSKLIVGPDIKLKGVEITDCDTLVVEGRVEATMDSRVIQIAERGAYVGTVGIDIAEIHGHFEGELTARQRLVIYATGSVSGKIRYGKIVVEEGGIVSGDVRGVDAPASTRKSSDEPPGGSRLPAPSAANEASAAPSEKARLAFERGSV